MKFQNDNHAITWIRDRYVQGDLELKPPYQRQPVWLAKQKSSLIETILLSLPIPEVFIQHVIEKGGDGQHRSKYYVVDGQQRIRTILQFMSLDRDEKELEWNGFSLDKLPADSIYKGYSFAGLDETQTRAFLSYRLSVRSLEDASDQSVRDMFRRLNKFLTKLNDQELRNATYTGPFARLAASLAEKAIWVEYGLVSPAQIRRMKDIELASELLIGVMHGPQAGSAKAIDEYYVQYDDYEDEFPDQKMYAARFDEALKTFGQIFTKSRDSRFKGNRTDFYSMFVAIAVLLRTHTLDPKKASAAHQAIDKFAANVEKRMADENARVSTEVVRYVRAVQKGANDKTRRAERHSVLTALISPFFKSRKK